MIKNKIVSKKRIEKWDFDFVIKRNLSNEAVNLINSSFSSNYSNEKTIREIL